jgi:hypothetical protein
MQAIRGDLQLNCCNTALSETSTELAENPTFRERKDAFEREAKTIRMTG